MDTLTPLRPTEERMNGHAGDTRGNRITNRSPWVRMPEPYDNLEVRVWLDYPQEVADLWTAQPNETPEQASARVMEACKAVFIDHRGEDGGPWEDDQGALPMPDTNEFWRRIPTQLGRRMVEAFMAELQGNPTSRALRRQKRKNWEKR